MTQAPKPPNLIKNHNNLPKARNLTTNKDQVQELQNHLPQTQNKTHQTPRMQNTTNHPKAKLTIKYRDNSCTSQHTKLTSKRSHQNHPQVKVTSVVNTPKRNNQRETPTHQQETNHNKPQNTRIAKQTSSHTYRQQTAE